MAKRPVFILGYGHRELLDALETARHEGAMVRIVAKCSWCGVTGVPLMVVHVSSGDANDIIAAAPRRGVT
ncbi:hypothetical protein ASD01_32280 [Ensifer sp. Root423]|uniref:hypothetical protein n=1 Tax=Ensifer sp. Root423 TaxID=1736534 RepID=UPI0007132EAA|nr:hypothetical protein [Ensifer sp. Root423]KQX16643.1 hypothetical protein ASD01_32280 [Ensifer sp. Root423]